MITNEVLITADSPKINPNEKYLLYAPLASKDNYGVVKLGDGSDDNYYLKEENGILNLDIDKARRELRGEPGPQGPKGEFTDEDKREVANLVLAKLPIYEGKVKVI